MLHVRTKAVVVAACGALSLSTPAPAETCDRFEELFATTPAPPQNPAQWRFYSERLAAATPGNYDLLLLGDSLAQLWPDASLSPLKVANLGLGGDSTQHLLWRLASPEMNTLKPSKVLFVIGTNNLVTGSQPCAIVAGIATIIRKSKETWPSAQLVFLEIPPSGADFMSNNNRRLEINAAVRLIPGVKTINVDNAITCGWQAPCVNYADDHLHFHEPGYRVLGKAAHDALFRD